jgi:hypothetical protein
MTLAELIVIRPDLASVHYAGLKIDGAYFDEETGRWTLHCVNTVDWAPFVLHEARCRPGCLRCGGQPYVWVEESHVCCQKCVDEKQDGQLRGADKYGERIPHRYSTCHE